MIPAIQVSKCMIQDCDFLILPNYWIITQKYNLERWIAYNYSQLDQTQITS